MQPTSFIQAIHVAANFYGRDPATDREYLGRQINKLRSAAWKEPSMRLAYFKRPGCECVECVTDMCSTGCTQSYAAITFDVTMVGIHTLTHNGCTIDLATDPLPNAGCCGACSCKLYELMVERFPLKRSIPSGYQNKLIFKATSTEDNGKKVGIRYLAKTGGIIRADIVLSTEGNATEWNVAKVLELTLPPNRCGWVKVQTVDGYDLDAYHPSVHAPMHMRVKLAGVPQGALVHWEGFMEPLTAIFDTDFIEFGGELDITNGLQWMDLHFKTGRSTSEERAYSSSMAMFQNSGQSELAAQATVPVATLRPQASKQLRRRLGWLMGR